jgi:phospho-N-acetylmuramoyl-pentapeptide-transferase
MPFLINWLYDGLQVGLLCGVAVMVWQVIIRLKHFFISPKAREFLTMGSHTEKRIIPSMGGIAFFLLLPLILWKENFSERSIFISLTAGLFGLLGAIDDISKIKRGRGISIRSKLFFGFWAALIPSLYFLFAFPQNSYINFFFFSVQLKYFFVLWLMWVMTATVHAVNLVDGIDGLAITQVWLVSLFSIIFTKTDFVFRYSNYLFLQFFFQNKPPAKIFMGDVGAFFLGGLLASQFLVTKTELLLPFSGIIFVANTVICLIQIISFKWFKKRVFSFTPFHHALELRGWSEKKINLVYSAITILVNITLVTIIYIFQ